MQIEPWLGLRLAVAALALLLSTQVSASTATFENFNEGDFFIGSFTEPLSGIHFTDITGPHKVFVIEFADTLPGMPSMTPGHFLTASGKVPGGGALFAFQFGFTGILPNLADRVSITVGYVTETNPLLVLQGFDSSGGEVAMTTLAPSPGFFIETELVIQSAAIDIQAFTITAQNINVGYDNITFIPEPAVAMTLLATVLLKVTPSPRSSRSLVAAFPGPGRR